MLALFRKWSIELRRRRLRKERETLKSYKVLEEDARGDAQRCHNCKSPLTGPYCHICGQRDDDLRRPIWTFFRELMDALFDTDSKIIKTIILLLLVPGGLSRAFNMGRRARFLPPLRLYVVLSFAFFITLSVTNILILDIKVTPKESVVAERQVKDQRQALQAEMDALRAELQADAEDLRNAGIDPGNMGEIADLPEMPELPPTVPNTAEREEEIAGKSLAIQGLVSSIIAEQNGEESESIAKAQEKIRELLEDPNRSMSEVERNALEKVLEIDVEEMAEAEEKARASSGDSDFPYDFDIAMFVPNDGEKRDGIDERDLEHILSDEDTPEQVKTLTRNFAETLRNPKEFNDLFNDALPWAMVILVPVFALILKVTHWGKNRYYLNQLVFALHFHGFLFILLTAFAFIVPETDGEEAIRAFWLITSGYLIIALKVGQEQSWIRAFFKAGFIYISYFLIMFVTIVFTLLFQLGDFSIAELFS